MRVPTHLIPRSFLRLALDLIGKSKYPPFERSVHNAMQQQRDWLLRRVQACRDTTFGRDHGFGDIRTLADFRRRVPVAPYDHFRPYIEAVARGETDALLPADDKLLQFTITTGSTGSPKLNPVTASWLREYKAAWDVWGIKLFNDHPRHIGAKVLQMAGTWDMGRTPSGKQISMVSSLLARHQSPFLRPFYALPEILNNVPDPVARHYAALRLCITEDIGWIVLMNPGSLIRLAEIGDQHKEILIRDVTDGTLTPQFDFPAPIREALSRAYLRPDRAVGQRLQTIAQQTGKLLPRDYWKQPVIACWLGGTAGFQSRYLRSYFGDSPLRDMGLVSSEGRHTVPLEDEHPRGVIAVGAGFYEFVPLEDRGTPPATVLEGHELTVGQDYRILISNSGGYFRFDIGDVVRCQGFHGQSPLLEFRQKLERVGDLEGEKLTEHQIIEGAHAAAEKLGISVGLVTGVPYRSAPGGQCYVFLTEISDLPDAEMARRFLEQLDTELAQLNFLWRARRKEGVVGKPRLMRLPVGAWDQHMKRETSHRGTGDYQYKHPGLIQDENWLAKFSPIDTITLD